MKRLHIIFDRLPRDLALVIALTLACILFVMVPPLNETPVRVVLVCCSCSSCPATR